MKPINDPVVEFWNWFSAHSAQLMADSIPATTIDELEEKLFSVRELDWEIGPGIRKKYFMAISPSGDSELLKVTRDVIAAAPVEKLGDWEFYPAKPPKNWALQFSLDVNGREVEVNGKTLEFVVYKYKDGMCEIVLKPPQNPISLEADYLNWAATIIVDGEIGEEARMTKVSTIEVVKSWDEKQSKSSRQLEAGLLAKAIP